MKSAEQIEIEKWCEQNIDRSDATTLGAPESANDYLHNRLWKTLTEGIEIGRRLQRDEDKKKLADLL